MSGEQKTFFLKEKQVVTIRLFLIFMSAVAIGALITQNVSDFASYFDNSQYKMILSQRNAVEFLQFSASSCIKYSLFFAILSISSLTFFSSLAIHFTTTACGASCGIRIGILINCGMHSTHFVPTAIWIGLVFALAVLLCLWSVCFLNINKQFLNSRKQRLIKGKIYISPLIKGWALHSIVMAITYFLTWTLSSTLIYITL